MTFERRQINTLRQRLQESPRFMVVAKKPYELYPNLFPAKAATQGMTRAQVQSELAEARRTGDMVDARSSKKLYELYPNLYPAKS